MRLMKMFTAFRFRVAPSAAAAELGIGGGEDDKPRDGGEFCVRRTCDDFVGSGFEL